MLASPAAVCRYYLVSFTLLAAAVAVRSSRLRASWLHTPASASLPAHGGDPVELVAVDDVHLA
eukprot:4129368-Pyramimonas_sp.AAC.1